MISIKNAIPRNPVFCFRKPVSFTIEQNEQVAFVGPNGGGKSVIAQILTGRYPLKEGELMYDFSPSPVYENIKFIAFKDSYGPADSSYYMQQRWNSQDRDESPLVRDVLGEFQESDLPGPLFQLFGVTEMLDKQMVLLSSGEMRKFQLVKALLSRPRMLIIDNPFIGLDTEARSLLCDLLNDLIGTRRIQVVLLLARAEEIPDFVTHIIPVKDMLCGAKVARSDFKDSVPEISAPASGDFCPPDAFPASGSNEMNCRIDKKEKIIELRNVSIRYGNHIILNSLNWKVVRGEKWALLGRNGSGKSTLLSLICADNPQGYACDISLFGLRRGSGESIWDIKKRIGYVSPEMHRAYSENISAIDIVASGLHDSVGLYVRLRPEQLSVCEWWMDMFGILALKDRSFLQLSDGEQRMVLLARAFVKDPELLILDEPMHGLDSANRLLVSSIIEAFCRREYKTLIMVTHYTQELPQCITHRLILEKKNER